MSKDLKIKIEDRQIGDFNIRGFQYGSAFVTRSGAQMMVEQGGTDANPVFIAALQAFDLREKGSYKRAKTVAAIFKSKKWTLDESNIPATPQTVEPVF